jgi:hypothetical protein
MEHQEHFDYFKEIRTHYSSYHNHKEMMAWSGLVLYLITTGSITSAAIQLKPSWVLLVIITFLILSFIRNQLEMKDLGGSFVAASMWYMAQILNNNFSTKELESTWKLRWPMKIKHKLN